MPTFEISCSTKDRIALTVHGYERTASGELYDDNWLSVTIEICCGAFSGQFSAAIMSFELIEFLDQLIILHQDLKGKAIFATLEGQLEICAACDKLGNIQITGFAMDTIGIGNKLNFQFKIDQTYLPKTINQLKEITKAFPVRSE